MLSQHHQKGISGTGPVLSIEASPDRTSDPREQAGDEIDVRQCIESHRARD
jgi:hypothetical protein